MILLGSKPELFFSHRKPLLKRSLILNSMNKQRSVRNQSNGILFFSWSGGPSALTSEESGQLEMARRLILDREIDSELVPGEQNGIHFHASLELRIAYAKRGGRPRGGRYWGVGGRRSESIEITLSRWHSVRRETMADNTSATQTSGSRSSWCATSCVLRSLYFRSNRSTGPTKTSAAGGSGGRAFW